MSNIEDISTPGGKRPDRETYPVSPGPKNLGSGGMRPPYVPARKPLPVGTDKEESTVLAGPEAVTGEDSQPPTERPEKILPKGGTYKRLLAAYWQRRLWALPLTVLLILAVGVGGVMALPTTRYMVLAHFIQRSFKLTVTDSVTGSPVSGARVTLAGQQKETAASGQVQFVVPVGNDQLTISKTYYKTASRTVLVDLSGKYNSVHISLVATGRQVPVKVINKITGEPIPSAVITAGATNAKTDLNGQATIVLPASPAAQTATVTVDGYNDLSTQVTITSQAVAANTFALTPVGRIYFLSNLSGKVDVVSANLDGSGRTTVLTGTGNEDANNTLLLASRDWKYLALLSKRDGGSSPKLFLITTGTNKLTTIDSDANNFSAIGWDGHYFAYTVARTGTHPWRLFDTNLNSYNADTGKVLTITASSSAGTSAADGYYSDLQQPTYVAGNIVYALNWYTASNSIGVTGQQAALMSVAPDGTAGKTLKTVDAGQYYLSSLTLAQPDQLYFAVYANNGSNPNFYRLGANGNVTQSSTITSDSINQQYPTYLLSPSGKASFWAELRDGKNTLFTGDNDGSGGTQIASLSDYTPYGWFTDDYLLVEKIGSELYILSVNGGTPLKISDYYKPPYSLYGSGGGYGGL